jgi:type I restriction enzyme S subunit
MAGIYSFGKGVFEREPIRGAETSYKSLFRLRAGQFVISRLNGWEGAVDVVGSQVDGYLVSNEYPTFAIDVDRAEPGYLRWIARWPAFWNQLVPRGSMVRRKRVQVAQMFEVEIPLPSIEEQRQVARRLDGVRKQVTLAREAQMSTVVSERSLLDTAIWRSIEGGIASGWPVRRLGDVAEINPGRDALEAEETILFVPMAAVNERTGSVETPEKRTAGSIGSGYKQFRRADVIFARIVPCMQNGKAAIFEGPTTHGYGSTEFHVIRAGLAVSADWIHRFIRTREFRAAAAQRMTGTAGQQRVPADFLRSVELPVPPLDEQARIVVALDRLSALGETLADRRRKASNLLLALEPSLLNKTFAGIR